MTSQLEIGGSPTYIINIDTFSSLVSQFVHLPACCFGHIVSTRKRTKGFFPLQSCASCFPLLTAGFLLWPEECVYRVKGNTFRVIIRNLLRESEHALPFPWDRSSCTSVHPPAYIHLCLCVFSITQLARPVYTGKVNRRTACPVSVP